MHSKNFRTEWKCSCWSQKPRLLWVSALTLQLNGRLWSLIVPGTKIWPLFLAPFSYWETCFTKTQKGKDGYPLMSSWQPHPLQLWWGGSGGKRGPVSHLSLRWRLGIQQIQYLPIRAMQGHFHDHHQCCMGLGSYYKQEPSTRMSRHPDYRVANANLPKLKTES